MFATTLCRGAPDGRLQSALLVPYCMHGQPVSCWHSSGISQWGCAESEKRRASEGVETDPHRLETRQRQIAFGKNTLGYANYRKEVPK